jgi:hypothetical protein
MTIHGPVVAENHSRMKQLETIQPVHSSDCIERGTDASRSRDARSKPVAVPLPTIHVQPASKQVVYATTRAHEDPMRLALKLVLPVIVACVSPAAAQTTDDEWVRRCQENTGRSRVSVCEVRVERLPVSAAWTVDPGGNGGVAIYGWDRNEVEVHARIQAQAETSAAAQALAKQVSLAMSAGSLTANGPENLRNENWYVIFVVYTPRNTSFTAASRNGPLSAEGVRGRLELRTENGPVTLRDVHGAVHARTQNGPVTVQLSGTAWDGTGLDAETQNGPVTLIIPENYSAQLETGTTNGPFNIDFPVTVNTPGRRRGGELRTTLGSGGAPVRVRTTNGPVRLRRPSA